MQEALQILRGAVMIVYPMGLPPHDPIRLEFDNTEDLSGTQVNSIGACWLSSLHTVQCLQQAGDFLLVSVL